MKLDILAFGAHPDDVELGCAATMAKEIALGRSLSLKTITKEQKRRLFKLIKRAKKHVIEWEVEDLIQMDRIMKIRKELVILECKIKASDLTIPFPLQYFFDHGTINTLRTFAWFFHTYLMVI